ncbi:MAG: biotin-dependent carboxyltransferase family protein [Bacteroidetes bacterium]|nr:biotin-dependent carboxyltransferase family protein [Bacteroidota bacterium]
MSQLLGKAVLLRCPPGTSLQDEGRLAGAQFGIPTAGAMDQKSFRWANHILQNSPHSVALEMVQPGLRIQFDQACQIALAGAQVAVSLNQTPLVNSSLISIAAGDLLEVGPFLSGSRLYLCIQGGFQVERYLGSGSDFESITSPSKRSTQEVLSYLAIPQSTSLGAKPKWETSWFESFEIEAYRGADWALLSSAHQELIQSSIFHISKFSNRMGIQLEELVPNQLEDLPTNPVFPGTVQLTPGGKMIVLMRDAGVTGGYPRILHLTEDGQSQLAQKRVGDSIRFQLLDPIAG